MEGNREGRYEGECENCSDGGKIRMEKEGRGMRGMMKGGRERGKNG